MISDRSLWGSDVTCAGYSHTARQYSPSRRRGAACGMHLGIIESPYRDATFACCGDAGCIGPHSDRPHGGWCVYRSVSYTGVRVGVSVRRASIIAQATSGGRAHLDYLAAAQPQITPVYGCSLPVGNASLRTLSLRVKAGRLITGVQVVTWRQLIDELELPAVMSGRLKRWVGNRCVPYSVGLVPPPASHLRRAGYLADIAWRRLRASQVDAPSALLPLYAR